MAEVGVLNLTIRDNSEEAGKGLDALARALSAVKTAMEGFNLSPVGQQVAALTKSIDKTQMTTVKNLTGLFNAISNFGKVNSINIDTKPFEALRDALGEGLKIGDAADQMKQLQDTMNGDWGGGDGKVTEQFEQMSMDLDGLMRNVEETTEKIENDMQAFASNVNTVQLDFSKFDPSNLPLSALGMTTEEFRNGAAEAQKYGEVIRDTDRIVSQMKSDFQLDTFQANQNTGLIVYNENLENSWERICERTAEAKREFDEYCEGQKRAIFGNESIKPLWENPQIGPSLQGMFGSEQQWSMIEQISRATGLSTQNIVEQLYNLTNGLVNLRQAEEETAQSGAAEQVVNTIEEIGNYSSDTMSKIELLQNKIAHLWGRVAQLSELPTVDELGRDNGNSNAINNYLLQIGRTNEQLQKLIEKSHEAQNAMQASNYASGVDTMQRDYGSEMVDNMVANYSEIDLLTMKMEGMKQALADDINQNKVDTQAIAQRTAAIQSLSDKIEELRQKQEETTETTSGMTNALGYMGDGIRAMFPTITGLIKRFKSMAIMRAMRYVIREISKGFSEGVQNVYWYSKAIDGNLAASMDNAASTLNQFKNSIGAAASPLIQALTPAIQTVCSWLITAINYVNQFISLLSGQSTWTKALYTQSEAYEDNTKKAKGAASAAKDLLADWDELNIIQSNTGGGGGGSAKEATDYTKMFEDVSEYAKWIRNIIDAIEDQFGSVWNLAKKIALAILGWKVSSAFSGLIGALGALLGTAFTLDLVFEFTTLFDKKWLETGQVGWLIASVLTPLIGGFFLKKILGNVLDGRLAKLAIPLSLGISAIADMVTNVGNVDTSALSKESLGLSAVSALKVGGAAAYLAKTVMGHTLGGSLAGGAAIAIATFGVAVGIKAVARAVKGADTEETVKSIALSSLAVGLGAGLFAKIAGASLLGAIGFGAVAAGATILTLTAAIGIAALLTAANEKVKWGNFEATEEQIKAFVEDPKNGVFTVNPNTVLSIIDPLIEVKSSNEEGLKATVSEVQLDIKKLSLGLDDKKILDDLKEKIFGTGEEGSEGLIDQFRKTAASHEEIIETGMTLVPSTTSDDGSTKEIISRSGEAWTKLTGHMESLGRDLADHFEKAYSESITEDAKKVELKTIAELSQMMANVSAAITNGEQYETSMQLLESNLNNLSQGSWDQMFNYIEEYKKQIEDAYAKTYDQTTVSIAGQVSGLKTALDNEMKLADEALTEADKNRHLNAAKAYQDEYDYWVGILEERRSGRQEAIDLAVKNAENEETMSRINRVLASKIDKSLIDEGVVLGSLVPDFSVEYGAGYQQKIIESLFNEDGTASEGASDQIKTWFNRLIDGAFGDDAGTIEKAIELGLLGYGDVIDKTVIDQLAESIGIGKENSEVQTAWNSLIESLTKKATFEVPGVDDTKYNASLNAVEQAAYKTYTYIQGLFNSITLPGINFSFPTIPNSASYAKQIPVKKKASGGFVRSGDLVMANENGKFEMMGKMGNQPVVANNQQIVNGISQGVATANNDVVSELRTLAADVRKIVNKEFTVRYSPSSTAGRVNQMSADALSKVTG